MATPGRRRERRRAAATPPPSFDPSQPLPPVREMFKQALERAKDSFGEMFDDRAGIIDPGPGANLNKPPPELEDPAEREQWAASEREARERGAGALPRADPARGRAHALRHHRAHAVRGGDRAAAQRFDPARVYGVYRVPDRYDLKRNNENKVARRVGDRPRARRGGGAGDVHTAAFNRAGHWVARRFGEPCGARRGRRRRARARAPDLQPEDCFGLPRLLHVRGSDSESGKFWRAHVDGVLVFSRASARRAAHEAMQAEAPLALARGRAPFHVEILDWEAVAAWVAPTATARRARPRRSRTCRAAGRS